MASPLRHLRLGALAFLVAAFAALLALPTIAAQAGPPLTISANPNPVLLPPGQTSGTYTLSWVMNSVPSADFYVSVNGGPQAGPVNNTMSGSTPVTINVNATHVWTVFLKGDTKKAIASVTIKARPIDTSCKTSCLKLAAATPHGTFAQFHVIPTHVLPKLTAEVHKPGGSPIVSKTTTPSGTDWLPILSGLTPNTFFEWSVTATDEAGNTQVWKGSFTTLHRKVTVLYDPIKVIDDSDDLSEGDLKFWFGFKNQMDTNAFGEVGVDSGNLTHPNHTSIRMDAPDTVGLVVVGQDNDCDFFDFCSLPFETPATGPVGHGSDSLSDWATASAPMNVAVDGPGEAFTAVKNFSTTAFELQFSVKATVTVSYV